MENGNLSVTLNGQLQNTATNISPDAGKIGIQAEGDEWKAFAAGFGEDDEAHFLNGSGQIVRGAGQIEHDASVALLSKADELVVLTDDLGGATGEVEGEGGLVSAEVVDVEDEFCTVSQSLGS